MKARKGAFHSPTKGVVTTKQMIREISDFVKGEPDSIYRLVIGTDSQVKRLNGKVEVDYVTAVVVHRKGRGARYFWRKERTRKVSSLRQRIYEETAISLKAAEELVPGLREAVSPARYDLEIHIDVGALGKTREMIKEVVGMVNGSGFVAKYKPQAWGASSVADKYT